MTVKKRMALSFQLLLCLFVKAVCRLLPGRKRSSDIWLFSERGYDACDNAWALFRYVRQRTPQRKIFYILSKDSPDVSKVSACGRVLRRGSLRHLFLYFLPTVKISTHILGAAPYPALFCSRVGRRKLRAKGASVFLQHGVTCHDIPALYAEQTGTPLFVCAAVPEYEFVRTRFGYPAQAVCCPGFARFDDLTAARAGRDILFFPTWRAAAASLSEEAFCRTPYFAAILSLLSSEALFRLLEREDLRLVFAPHPEMRKFISCFHTDGRRIILDTGDIGDMVRRSAVLITDYSSVMFDFAYAKRPVIYLDVEGLRAPHYPVGYFLRERDGFGPVVRSLPALLAALADTVRRGFCTEQVYRERADRFFPRRDRNNCRRNFEAISEWIEKNRNI